MDADEYVDLLRDCLEISSYFYKDGVFHGVDATHTYMLIDNNPINEFELKTAVDYTINRMQELSFKIPVLDNAKTYVYLTLGDMKWIGTKKISGEFPRFILARREDVSFIGFLSREDADAENFQLKRRNMTGNNATSCYDSNLLGSIMTFLLKCGESTVSLSFNDTYPLSVKTGRFTVFLAPRLDEVLPKSFVVEDDPLSYEYDE